MMMGLLVTARSTSKKVAAPILLIARYRSKLEEKVAKQLEAAEVTFDYEGTKLKYAVPARTGQYTPDFHLHGNGKTIIIEAKGRFGHRGSDEKAAAERQKMAMIKEQYPDLDIRFVFHNANLPIYKGSKTTYAKWADSHGFPYADKGKVPKQWLSEITQ